MGHVIAVAGKGGVGKTTLCGLLIQYLCESGKKPVLAVDADANSNLNEVLGVEIGPTLGELREEIERAGSDPKYQIPKGITKSDWLETRMMDAVTEGEDFDLMVMGRSQGQGCYCFVNGLVQTQVQKLQSRYPYIVVDNEAGMEHVSRGILPQMEKVLLVSDCSRRGVQAAGRIAELMGEMHFHPDTVGLIVNRAPKGELDPGTRAEIEKQVITSGSQVIKLKGATFYAIASLTAELCGVILKDTHSIYSVSTLMQDYYGIKDVCISVPTVVGIQGAVRPIEIDFTDEEMTKLQNSAKTLREFLDHLSI